MKKEVLKKYGVPEIINLNPSGQRVYPRNLPRYLQDPPFVTYEDVYGIRTERNSSMGIEVYYECWVDKIFPVRYNGGIPCNKWKYRVWYFNFFFIEPIKDALRIKLWTKFRRVKGRYECPLPEGFNIYEGTKISNKQAWKEFWEDMRGLIYKI